MGKAIKTAWILAFSVCLLFITCRQEQREMMGTKSEILSIQANLVFFYYPDLEEAESFYGDILGLERVLDYGFAKIYRISLSTFIGLVDETKGMHDPSEPKTVTLSFVTQEIDQWYQYLKSRGVEIRNPLKDASRHATRGFVAYDPAGYFLEFERFLEHSQNTLLLDQLTEVQTIYPRSEQKSSRPENLGIMANIIWLYYRNVPEAQDFYEDNFGSKLLVDQGFAKVYSSTPSGFIGLVDETQGLHRFTPKKAVNVSFLTDQIDEWYTHLQAKGVKIRDSLEALESIPVKAFVAYDPAGYFIEFDRFLKDPKNQRILQLLQ
jgi:catechol 2,3-dioxygenase-like lactoylglutathione lyase family enzyme